MSEVGRDARFERADQENSSTPLTLGEGGRVSADPADVRAEDPDRRGSNAFICIKPTSYDSVSSEFQDLWGNSAEG